jgi:cyclopropane fatty-acyl-phospholipid synthase-like methyltransferase
MATVPDRSVFENAYAGKAPWDIGKPQKPFVEVADGIKGQVLDSGCGTGDLAIFLAGRGCQVTGVDFLEEPIRRAKKKADECATNARFLVKNALSLQDWTERFDHVTDSGLFHVFNDEDRTRYVAGLAHVLKPGGRIYLMCFSDAEPGTQGPRRVSKMELEQAFGENWAIESISPSRFEIRPDFTEMTFSEGGPRSWFLMARRI